MSSLLRNNAGITYTSVRDLERMGCPLQPSFLYRRLTTSEGRIVMVAVLKLPELCRSARALAWGSSEPSSDKQKHLNSARQHDRAHRYQRKFSYNPPKTSPTDILYANRPLRFQAIQRLSVDGSSVFLIVPQSHKNGNQRAFRRRYLYRRRLASTSSV